MSVFVEVCVLGSEAIEDWELVVADGAARAKKELFIKLGGLERCTATGLDILRRVFEAVAQKNATLDAVVCFEEVPAYDETVTLDSLRKVAVSDAEEKDEAVDCSAVGGTFDHLHAGHRLLLAATALATKKRVYVGIASDALLQSKKFSEFLEPFDRRAQIVVDYLKKSKPSLAVEVSALLDPKQPPKAATLPQITGLVVSEETLKGAEKLRDMRRDQNIEEPLAFIVVGLIAASSLETEKLSSTFLRSREQQEQALSKEE